VQDLSGRIAEQDATYTSEVAGLRRLIEMVEAREAQSKAIVENVEQEWATVNERVDRREAALREQMERERSRTEAAEARVEELERVLEKVNRGEFPVPAPGSSVPSTPARGSTDILTQGMMDLSPTVAMASRAQRSGKTFTEVYADHIRLQDEYAKKNAEYDRMARTLAQVLAQIEERVRVIQRLQRILVLTLRRRPSLPNNVSSTSGCSPSRLSLLLSSQMPSRNVILVSLRPPTSPNVSRRQIARTNCFRSS
jgi:nucleoprotein TPR